MATVRFENVNKIYDNNVQAVFDFNLEVSDKEFIVLVGPSGCGKSTTLRMLAGLEDITYGKIYIDDVVVNEVLPKNRDIAMVFQNYALYPHMTVYDNMAFALKMRHLPKEEIDQRVKEAAKVLALEEYLNRKPKALSGGQRQRVALGRAIVRTPKVFLMDEPLSNLDAKLRVQMRSEITRIHKKVNATTIYVTHDQTEAMTMADRIVIMKDGYIQQIGTPKEVYNNPKNMFVGGFIGSPAMNFLTAEYNAGKVTLKRQDDKGLIEYKLNDKELKKLKEYMLVKKDDINEMLSKIDEMTLKLQNTQNSEKVDVNDVDGNKLFTKRINKNDKAKVEERLQKLNELKLRYVDELANINKNVFTFVIGVRPEDIAIVDTINPNTFNINVELSELLGHELIVYTDIAGQKIIIKIPAHREISVGDKLIVEFDKSKVHFFDLDTQRVIDL